MFTRRHFEHGRNHRDDPPAEEGAAGSPFSSDYRQHPRGSTAVPGQLNDGASTLSRFLLRGVEASDMESMGDINAAWYALALEKTEVRNERIIMAFEVYGLFGVLFANVTWINYEWVHYTEFHEDVNESEILWRVYELIMSLAFTCNLYLALSGASFWLNSIIVNSGNGDYFLQSVTALSFCQQLLGATVVLNAVGCCIGVYVKLSPHWIETGIGVAAAVVLYGVGREILSNHIVGTSPLGFFHSPGWVRLIWGARDIVSPKRYEALKRRAKEQAERLERRAYHERAWLGRPQGRESDSSVGRLLRQAANNLGLGSYDTTLCEKKLAAELYLESDQMRDLAVLELARCMPLRLAKEVRRLLGSSSDTETYLAVPLEQHFKRRSTLH